MSLVSELRRNRNNNETDFTKYIYTGILLVTHMSYAISFSTMGPAFVDLTYTLNSSIDKISLISMVISVGNILGTFFGILYRYLNRQLIITGLLTLMAVVSTSIPFTTNLWQLYGCALIYGTCGGAWITVYNVWLIEMWQHQSSKVLFMSQLMYGSGAVLGPLLDSPYLTGKLDISSNATHFDNNTSALTNITHLVTVEERRSKLEVPFMISGGIQLIFPLLLFVMFVCNRYVKPSIKYEKTVNSTDNRPEDNRSQKVMTIVLLSICLSTINALELVYFNFGSTYFQYIPLKLSAQTAAQLVSVMSAAYTVGQVINFFVSFIFKTEYIIGSHFVMSFAVFVSLIFAQNTKNLLWVISAGVGLSVSVLFPAILGFFGRYLDITDRIATLVWICCGVVGFVPPVLLGQFIDSDPTIFILIELVFMFISFSSFIIFLYFRRKL